MKGRYKFSIVILGIMFIVFVLTIGFLPYGEHSQLKNIIQGAGIFVALLTAIIALSTADRKRNSVKVEFEHSIGEIITYQKNEMTEYCKNLYKYLPNSSHQVNFKMTNISGFTLENSTLTFVLPYEKQPPCKKEDENIYNRRAFTTNNPYPPTMLFTDKVIISTPFLPYWNDKDSITIWIRMIIDDGQLDLKPFDVKVSVNCSNADGKTYTREIKPKILLKNRMNLNH